MRDDEKWCVFKLLEVSNDSEFNPNAPENGATRMHHCAADISESPEAHSDSHYLPVAHSSQAPTNPNTPSYFKEKEGEKSGY